MSAKPLRSKNVADSGTYSMITANDPVSAQAVLGGIEEGVKVEIQNSTADLTVVGLNTAIGEIAQNATFTTAGGSQSTEIIIQDDGNITDREGTNLFITAAGELTYDNVGGSLDSASATNLTAAIAADEGAAGNSTLTLEDGSKIVSNAAATNVTIEGAKISCSYYHYHCIA